MIIKKILKRLKFSTFNNYLFSLEEGVQFTYNMIYYKETVPNFTSEFCEGHICSTSVFNFSIGLLILKTGPNFMIK